MVDETPIKKKAIYNNIEIPGHAMVWHGCVVTEDEIPELEKYMTEKLGSPTTYLTTKITNPDKDDDGNDVPDTGDRHDVIILAADTSKVIMTKLQMGLRWYEDVLGNGLTYKE